MLSPKQCNIETRNLAEKQIREKEKTTETLSGFTPLVGHLFHEDGTAIRHPGVAFIFRLESQSPAFKALMTIQSRLKSSEFSQDLTFPPASSLHVPLADYPNRTKVDPPKEYPEELTLQSVKLLLTDEGLLQLKLASDKKEYHTTLAYQIFELSPHQLEKIEKLLEKLFLENREDLLHIKLENPAMYRYNNLISFFPI